MCCTAYILLCPGMFELIEVKLHALFWAISAVVISREVMQTVYMHVAADYNAMHGPKNGVVTPDTL